MAEKSDPTLLEQLHERRQKAIDAWEAEIAKREKAETEFEQRKAATDTAEHPSEDEIRSHDESVKELRESIAYHKSVVADYDQRIKDQEERVERRNAAADASKGAATVESEPLTYRRDNAHERSYYADLAVTQVEGITLQRTNRTAALARLQRHAQEMEVELPKRQRAAEARAKSQFEAAEHRSATRRRLRDMDDVRPLDYDPFQRSQRAVPGQEQRVTPNRTDGQGGYFVPPLWLPEEYIPFLRAQAAAKALCRQLDLPSGTDSINIPKLATGTGVGYQTSDNAGVVTNDWTDTYVQANVKTAAGDSDVALQLLEQSPNGITDEVITTDLMAAYDNFVGAQVIAGTGANTTTLNGGQIMGLYPATNWSANGVTYTDGSPAGSHFAMGALGPMASKIARTRFDVSDFAVVLHGRRWFWYSTSPDANGRPLGESLSGGRFNASASVEELAAFGHVGSLPYLADAPVYVDNNIPTNDTTGGGSGQDVAIAALWDDLWLFQGDLRTNVYKEVLSGSLGVRFQVYNYFAFLARYGQSVAVATGSGFAAPSTGYGDTF